MFFTVNLLKDSSKYSNYISDTLLDRIEEALERKEKVLLYLNKRGTYSSLICTDCEYLHECPNCDISLTVHKASNSLECHLCNHHYKIPLTCKRCFGTSLKPVGIGTQKVEELMNTIFPKASIYRFDSDAMKTVSSKKQAIKDLEEADIIIGTKMLTTGFDFEKVGCIGVILIESELIGNTYDSEEKAYSNIRQLIGRGNRKDQRTDIVLQTFIPNNTLIQRITDKNFKDFFTESLQERKDFLYPPFCEIVIFEYRNKKSSESLAFIKKLCEELTIYRDSIGADIELLAGTSSFKKNNSHHTKLILKGNDLRSFIEPYKKMILGEKNLSVIFDS